MGFQGRGKAPTGAFWGNRFGGWGKISLGAKRRVGAGGKRNPGVRKKGTGGGHGQKRGFRLGRPKGAIWPLFF